MQFIYSCHFDYKLFNLANSHSMYYFVKRLFAVRPSGEFIKYLKTVKPYSEIVWESKVTGKISLERKNRLISI